ncbi:hypothetical protein UK23_33245 [Lentzea aerocolonigenes]|uniref:Uncharacterized protein n=1 Tax=Lentzea aerocolonigenes TaxID=68170 RepID=A0A0F0GLM1_LENAE|nr:hypothetical protein [Lentzea aerocolonigenes]KJK43436.1 hypothetical protein UK23_33245 [Lentzea aerocolonigenes]
MLIKANFGVLDDTARQIMNTLEQIGVQMDHWKSAVLATEVDWQDGAHMAFGDFDQLFTQVSTARQTMLDALRGGIENSNQCMQQALSSATARVSNTTSPA